MEMDNINDILDSIERDAVENDQTFGLVELEDDVDERRPLLTKAEGYCKWLDAFNRWKANNNRKANKA